MRPIDIGKLPDSSLEGTSKEHAYIYTKAPDFTCCLGALHHLLRYRKAAACCPLVQSSTPQPLFLCSHSMVPCRPVKFGRPYQQKTDFSLAIRRHDIMGRAAGNHWVVWYLHWKRSIPRLHYGNGLNFTPQPMETSDLIGLRADAGECRAPSRLTSSLVCHRGTAREFRSEQKKGKPAGYGPRHEGLANCGM